MTDFLLAALRMASPLGLMALGGTWTLQTGVLNIGQEGGLILAAFFAAWGNHVFASWIAGILCAVAAAVIYNMIFAFFCVTLRANIWVVGMALNIFGDALSVLCLKALTGGKGAFRSPRIEAIPEVSLGILPDCLKGLSLVIWIFLALALVFCCLDRKTVFGLRIKAAGENEEALKAAGVSAARLRYAVIAINALMAGLAGSYLSTSYLTTFTRGMSADRGWMAVAAVIFGDGHLGWTLFAVGLFGAAQAAGIQLQTLGLPSHLALMLPYALAAAALILRSFRKTA